MEKKEAEQPASPATEKRRQIGRTLSKDLGSLLCEAASNGDLEDLRKLIDAGISPNSKDYDRRTPLHLAAAEGHLGLVQYLVEKGAEVDAADRWGGTPLQDSLRSKKDDVSAYLKSKGGSVNVSKGDLTSLLCNAAGTGALDEVKRLINNGANANSSDYDKRTPLHLASSEGHYAVVEYLLQQRANPNALDRWGGSPLRDAVRHKHDSVSEALRNSGAKMMMAVEDVASILCSAAKKGDVDQVQRLLTNGADPNSVDYDRRAALHVAASEGHELVASLLIKAGANVNMEDRWGSTPVQDARRQSHQGIVNLLTESGATGGDLSNVMATVNFTASLQRALPMLCEKGNWAYAEVWFRHEEKHSCMVCSSVWYCEDSYMYRILPLRKVSEGQQVFDRQGVIGDALATKKPQWLDSSRGLDSKRQWLAEEVGMKSGLAVPVIYESDVVAVMLFISFDAKKKDSDQNTTFAAFATRLVLSGILHNSQETVKLSPILQEQKNVVYQLIAVHGVFNSALIQEEVDYFYAGLGLGKYYFEHFPPQMIAKHIHTFIAGKKVARVGGDAEDIRINFEQEDANFYLCPNKPKLTGQVDSKIQKFLEGTTVVNEDGDTVVVAKRLTQVISAGATIPGGSSHLALYVLEPVSMPVQASSETDIWTIATGAFLRMKSSMMREKYQEILEQAVKQLAPVIKWFEKDIGKTKILVAIRREASRGLFSTFSQLLTYNKVEVTQKFVEHFTNGYVVYSIDIQKISEAQLEDVINQMSLCALIPITIAPLMMSGLYSTNELTYAYAISRFVYYFLRPRSDEYSVLYSALKDDPINSGRLVRLRKAMQKEFLTETRTLETVTTYPSVVKKMYKHFARQHKPESFKENIEGPDDEDLDEESLISLVNKTVKTELDIQILKMYITFNQCLIKTNFYQSKKSSLAFRLHPQFLASMESLPELPFAVFLVIGREFRGFHIRFRDIARGGVRIIRSANPQIHDRNKEFLFEENYGLAYTQQLKNKDIPEGGSKGTILLGAMDQDKATISFQKYVDGLLDLLMGSTEIVDHYKKPEILFLGPDEGTADLMDWAAEYAKSRGAPFWKAFTTGKSTTLGGIPHDVYGMTTRSVHSSVLGILKYRGIAEESITKLQTGGPDGDLGSNEIKISKDKTIGIVDGSGVLYDPEGINRDALLKLANARKMINIFPKEKLSKKGFMVLVEDRGIVLPDGTVVENGMLFRNEFHLSSYAHADLFVPCGGRPESVHINNYQSLLDDKGAPKLPIVIEGANLFFTADARLALEKAGVFIIKDASANKGGVTSSSLEVLAALALSDSEFAEHMSVFDGQVPQFYQEYVKEVQQTIEENARLEFECILKEHIKDKTACSLITDKLSEKINRLNDKIKDSSLWTQTSIRRSVLEAALPKKLLQLVGFDLIVKRVPENYLQAIFGAYLASHYIYQYGLSAPEFQFTDFMSTFNVQS